MADSNSSGGGGGGGGASKPKSPSVPLRLPHRVADYFLVVGGVRQSLDGDANQTAAATATAAGTGTGATPEASTQPRPKTNKLAWTPRVLDRFPRVDHLDAEMPKDLEMFCFPTSYELSGLCQSPEAHCFVLTEADGTRVYGCALKFWEPIDEARLATVERGLQFGFSEEDAIESSGRVSVAPIKQQQQATTATTTTTTHGDSSGQIIYAPKSFVIVSHWAFFSNFERFLSTLHKNIYVQSEGNVVPIERVLTNFIFEVPLPPPGRFEVESRSFLNPFMNSWLNSCPWSGVSTTTGGIIQSQTNAFTSPMSVKTATPFLFSRPPPNKAPMHDFPLSTLFRWLSLDNILALYAAVLTERRVLFVTDKLYKLAIAAETITYLLCPFYWRHIYIPLLPARLTDFICAPMPYVVGIHRKNMPDDLMLDQVVVVDLDHNSIVSHTSDPLPTLPSDRLASLMRHLKKLVVDPQQPIKPSQQLADNDIEQAFLKFHVRMFSKYRDYLEAPSEYILDKFQKQRFLSEHSEGGGGGGGGGLFLQEFMETQMFQCFIDDRYDQSTRITMIGKGTIATNFEILFFDETIDASHGKPTPFLQDSSQNIVTSSRHAALPPSTEGLPKGALYKYTTIPIPLSRHLFGVPREVKDLAGDDIHGGGVGSGGSDVGSRRRFDMEKVSMKFFQEKRLYSQHFHTLRLRSSKQDTAFKDICAYFRSEQAVAEMILRENERQIAVVVEKDTPDTSTTIDAAWLKLRRSVQDELSLAMDSFRIVREDVALPLYACTSEREHQLKILFGEANTIEMKAAKGKSVVERAKSTSIVAFQRYESLKETMRQRVLTTNEISRIVAAQDASEDSRLDLDESETSFQTIIAEYEERMPQIIEAIRQCNKERIVQLKSSMTRWVDARRLALESQLAQLNEVSQAVSNIDVDKDLISFSEGTTDFWSVATTRGTNMVEKKIETTNTPNMVATTTTTSPNATNNEQKVNRTVGPAATLNTPNPSTSPMTDLTTMNSTRSTPPPLPVPTGSPSLLGVGVVSPASASPSPSPAAPSSTRLVRTSSEPAKGLCYPLFLWGIDGFERAAAQSSLTRKVMKEFQTSLTSWFEILDFKSKKLGNIMKLVPDVTNLTTNQRTLWDSLKLRSSVVSKGYNEFGLILMKIISDLSLTKGELKMSILRFREHRIKLEKEVATANDVQLRSLEKKERTARALALLQKQQSSAPLLGGSGVVISSGLGSGAYPPAVASRLAVTAPPTPSELAAAANAASLSANTPASLVTQKQLDSQAQVMERIAREAKEAAHEHTLNVRNSQAIQRKHDICVSRLLRLFEKKERYCYGELKKSLAIIAEQFHALVICAYRKGDDSLLASVKRVDHAAELREFIESVGGRVTAPPPITTSQTGPASSLGATSPTAAAAAASSIPPDFGRHLGPNGYAAAANLLQVDINFVRSISILLDELHSTDDFELKMMRKVSWKIRSPMNGSTLQSSTASFEQFLDRLCEITDDNLRSLSEVAGPIAKLKSSLKTIARTHEVKMGEIDKAHRKAIDDRDRAVLNERAADDVLKLAHAKVEQAEKDDAASPGGAKKGLFSTFMSTSLKDLQQKEATATRELEKAKLATQEKEQGLLQATAKRASELKLLLQDMQLTDAKRWNSQSELLLSLLSRHSLHVDKMQTLVHNFSSKVFEFSIEGDIIEFISKNQTTIRPPEYVREDYTKYVDAVAMQAAESERARKAAAHLLALEKANNGAGEPTPATVESHLSSSPSSPLPSTQVPSPSKMPTSHHGYSNSTSLLHARNPSHVTLVIPPPVSNLPDKEITPSTVSRARTNTLTGGASMTSTGSVVSPPTNNRGPPPLPANIIQNRAQTNTHEQGTSETQTALKQEAHSTHVSGASIPVDDSNSQPSLLPVSDSTVAPPATHTYEFNDDSGSRSVAATTDDAAERNQPGEEAEADADDVDEIQDENGDWLKTHAANEYRDADPIEYAAPGHTINGGGDVSEVGVAAAAVAAVPASDDRLPADPVGDPPGAASDTTIAPLEPQRAIATVDTGGAPLDEAHKPTGITLTDNELATNQDRDTLTPQSHSQSQSQSQSAISAAAVAVLIADVCEEEVLPSVSVAAVVSPLTKSLASTPMSVSPSVSFGVPPPPPAATLPPPLPSSSASHQSNTNTGTGTGVPPPLPNKAPKPITMAIPTSAPPPLPIKRPTSTPKDLYLPLPVSEPMRVTPSVGSVGSSSLDPLPSPSPPPPGPLPPPPPPPLPPVPTFTAHMYTPTLPPPLPTLPTNTHTEAGTNVKTQQEQESTT